MKLPVFGRVTKTDAKGRSEKPPRTPDEEIVWQELTKRWDPHGIDGYHQAFHREWWLDLAYYAGYQWAQFTANNELKIPEAPAWRVRYVSNRIWPMVMRAHAAMVAEQASFRAAPGKNTIEAKNSALLADRVYEWAIEHLGYEEVREEALLWAVTTGTGFMKVTWNPALGGSKTVVVGDKQETVDLGDVELDCASPFQVRFPQFVSSWRHLPWIIQVTVRPIEYVQERWPKKAQFVTPSMDAGIALSYENSVRNIVGNIGSVGAAGTTGAEAVKIIELWTKPFVGQTKDGPKHFTKGLHVVCTSDGIILEAQDNPYHEVGLHLPYVPYTYGVMPGRLWGMGLIGQLRVPQYNRNLVRSMIIEHQNLMSFGKWVAPKGHGVPKTGFTSEPGEVIEYNPSLPAPDMKAPPPLPGYVLENVAMIDQEMQDIGAQQDATEAKAPSSVRSGVAIQLLQQKDREVLAIPRKRLWRSDKQAGEHILALIHAFYAETRTLEIVGPGRVFEVMDFKGADLQRKTTFRVFAESGFMDSRVARQQTIMDLIQIGLFDPKNPDDRKAIFRMIELGDVRDIVSRMAADERIAESENQAMMGQPPVVPPVNWFDDDQVHMNIHEAMLKSPLYLALDPTLRAGIDAHVQAHAERLAAKQAAAMAATEASRGAPGEKGKASQAGAGTRGGSKSGGTDDGERESDDRGGGKSGGGSDSGGGKAG